MEHTGNVMNLARLLAKTSEKIEFIAQSEQIGGPSDVYDTLILDELSHVQIVTLEMTRLLAGTEGPANGDGEGTVFSAGELNHVEHNAPEEFRKGENK